MPSFLNVSIKEFLLSVAANVAAANVSGEEMIGYLIGLACLVGLVVGWHRKQRDANKLGMGSTWFMVLAGLVAAISVGALVYGIALRTIVYGDTKSGKQLEKSERLLKDPYIDLSTQGRLSLQGRFTRPDGPVTVYVTYGAAQHGLNNPSPVISGKLAIEPRIKISKVDHFDRDEQANLTIGYVTSAEGNQKIIQWGEPAQNNTKVGITWGGYFGFVIFVWKDGKEDSFPFSIIPRSVGSVAAEPLFIGPDVLSAHSEINPNAQK